MDDGGPILEADDLVAGYGEVDILHGVSISVPPNAFVSVLGPNGAGKSTLLKTIYGIVPPPLASTIQLTPVMSLTSRVVAVKGLRPGEGVGYGWRYQADAPQTVAVIPAGYADGLDTRLCGRGHVLIRGQRAPIVGAVSMDMITVDVTTLGDLQPVDEVVLLGRQGSAGWQQIAARDVAAAIGTIPWAIVCRLGARVEGPYE